MLSDLLTGALVGTVVWLIVNGIKKLKKKKQTPELPQAPASPPTAPEPKPATVVTPTPQFDKGNVPPESWNLADRDPWELDPSNPNSPNHPLWELGIPKSYFQLRCLSGEHMGKTFSLLAGSGEVLGRNPNGAAGHNIRFAPNTPGVSANHCTVAAGVPGKVGPYEAYAEKQEIVITLTDNGSTYGTYLSSGRRLTPNQPVTLRTGDVFYLAGKDGPAFRLEEMN